MTEARKDIQELRIGVHAEGRLTDEHQLPITDFVQVLQGVSNLARRSSALILRNEVDPSLAERASNDVHVYVEPPQAGSFAVDLIIQNAHWIAGSLVMGVAANRLDSLLVWVFQSAIGGRPIDPPEGFGRTEQSRKELAKLLQKVEPSLHRIAQIIGDSTDAITITINKKAVVQLDEEKRNALLEEITSEDDEVISGYVMRYNERTGKGMLELSKPLPAGLTDKQDQIWFWTSDDCPRDHRARLAYSLYRTIAPGGEGDFALRIMGRRVLTRGGRLKRFQVREVFEAGKLV